MQTLRAYSHLNESRNRSKNKQKNQRINKKDQRKFSLSLDMNSPLFMTKRKATSLRMVSLMFTFVRIGQRQKSKEKEIKDINKH